METSAKDDWYSTYSGPVTRDVRLPVSAPGSPLLPGCRSNCTFDRFTYGGQDGRQEAEHKVSATQSWRWNQVLSKKINKENQK